MKRIFADNNAGTRVDPRVVVHMHALFLEGLRNPESIHTEGVRAKQVLKDARATIAKVLGVHAEELVFVANGSEANNLAVRGVCDVLLRTGKKGRMVMSAIDHPSLHEIGVVYEKKGFPCSFVSSDVHGHLSFEELEAVLSSEVALVSLSWVHHEIGVVQDIARVRALMRERAPQALLHIDASQAPLWRGVFPHTLGADLLTLDAHKMRGPKGVGCLFVRSGVVFDPLILGGGQEGGRRAGTPAVEIISGFAEAVRLVAEEREGWVARVREAHDVFVARVQELVPEAVLYSGTGKDVAPHLALFSFPQKKSDEMVLALDKRGVACSAGSACTRDGGNKTLRALGFEKEAEHAVRFSFDTDISREDAILVAEKIGEVLQRK